MAEFGNRVRAARAYAGLDQPELATRLGISTSTMQRIEYETRGLKPFEERAMTEAIAEATGVPPAFFTTDFTQLGDARPPTDELGALAHAVGELSKDLTAHREATERQVVAVSADVEKLGRSVAHDRGRLTRIEKSVEKLTGLPAGVRREREGQVMKTLGQAVSALVKIALALPVLFFVYIGFLLLWDSTVALDRCRGRHRARRPDGVRRASKRVLNDESPAGSGAFT